MRNKNEIPFFKHCWNNIFNYRKIIENLKSDSYETFRILSPVCRLLNMDIKDVIGIANNHPNIKDAYDLRRAFSEKLYDSTH